ncbi:MAG: polyprenyl synthetase family protein, partial [Acetatifactor sp.]|nr:polyprenyl synthetase family protein [Acetatifactor sp.]
MELQEIIQQKAAQIEEIIKKYLPAESGLQHTVLEAMNYSMLAGGKRLRPMLMQEVYRMFGGSGREIEPLMTAIEMIHTYSLVHDDLPAMDNDEYRRGRRTTHAVYGEAIGILAGDGLLNLAWETAMTAFAEKAPEGQEPIEEAARLQRIAGAISILAGKAGIHGMIGGQTADIEGEGAQQLSMVQLL